jgi:hypothetical protein
MVGRNAWRPIASYGSWTVPDPVDARSRFLMLKPQRALEATPLSVIVTWFGDLRRRVPASP